jgi:hypothetical protein
MDKSVLTLLGGASALALMSGGAMAANSPATAESGLKPAQSYADLLDSIPNAVNTLRAEDQKAENAGGEPLQLAQYVQYGYPRYHHHHHHHHNYYSYWYWRHRYHHHHHHHHHAVVIPVP